MKSTGKLVIFLITFVAVATTACNVAAAIPDPLPSAAQEAIDRGVIAAKVPDYLLAIRYFEEARKLAPDAPVIYLNLGLAESKIPGRELRAMAWFGAYLAAYPDAPNAAAVKEQIIVMEVTSQSIVSRLMKSVQDAAHQIDTANQGLDDLSAGVAHVSNLTNIAQLWAEAGDITSALNTADLLQGPSAYAKDKAQALIARSLAISGDTAGAFKIVEIITPANYAEKSSALLMVGQVQTLRANHTDARESFLLARQVASQMEDTQTRNYRLVEIASGQAEAGDISGAQETVTLIQGEYADSKESAQLDIVSAQAKSGDLAGARNTADLIQYAPLKKLAQEYIAEAQANAGVSSQPDSAPSSDNQAASKDSVTVYNWIHQLEDPNDTQYTQGYCYRSCPLNTMLYLDFSAHLKSLPTSGDPQVIFDALYTTASKIIIAKNVVSDLLKQQEQL